MFVKGTEILFLCSEGDSGKPLLQQESSQCRERSPFFSSKFLEEIYQISISKRKANTLLICLYFSTVLFVLCHILLFSVCRCKVTNNFPSGKIFMPLHRKKNGCAARRSGLAEGGFLRPDGINYIDIDIISFRPENTHKHHNNRLKTKIMHTQKHPKTGQTPI